MTIFGGNIQNSEQTLNENIPMIPYLGPYFSINSHFTFDTFTSLINKKENK
jgi:hypothetical protein